MINCLKYAQQCQNGIFKKTCRSTTVPYLDMWISHRYNVIVTDSIDYAIFLFFVCFCSSASLSGVLLESVIDTALAFGLFLRLHTTRRIFAFSME